MTEKIKLVISLLLVAAGVAGFYLLADQALVVRILAFLAGIVVALLVVKTTPVGQNAISFAREAVLETRKVVWPTRKETIQTTAAVFGLVIIMAIFLWIVDVGFMWAVKQLMGRGA
ncbi:preprotein translocase subunit SecE [Methylobacillus flagellatus]|uniref:Protein translocase subunit SecE n=1 Tax=Methylobacillus flagellatus (strain ATCC 51484 / DSM 6875 / VKM B-1610 / KT) TaxID=265072 RepID=Q1H4Q0_METFK|nr:preprotein translocase subunit SecE [Methylobacillus flagellatus]ABE48537.1 protein translocase subunit secE/sec61 gamma [Methylobacillus flagellatus KT]